ncbi:MAG: hypothetical protein ACU84Q_20790 [Gammaproteobacteria bacterium]
MNKLIIALTLSVISSASFADGFRPWDERVETQSQGEPMSFNMTVNAPGFAPWRDGIDSNAFTNEKGVAMDIVEQNVFRPWS